jgi:hypothetical protein
MTRFNRVNNISGFLIFGIALLVYWLCMEPTLSFWDCGEFIAAAFKMEVGHQPGAPLFLMIGKLFSLLAGNDVSKVAYWINFLTVTSSAATIMFLFWTINAIALKMLKVSANQLSILQTSTIMAAGALGALSYTFSDTFWFSAVESEVYGLSTLCTAIVFWAMLKWEQQLNDRWILFIAFIIGLSIGIHLLSLLAFPAISLIYYFRKTAQTTIWGGIKAFLVGCVLLAIVQFGIIQYFVNFAAKTDLFTVNVLKMPFGTGALLFIAVVAVALTLGIRFSIKRKNPRLNLALLSLVFVLFGFSSYFMIIIRANAKTNINLSNPDTPMSLLGYLSRTQYEDKPLLYGQPYNAKAIDAKETGKTYRKGEKSYEVSGKTFKTVYDKNTLLPRMYSDKPEHVRFYQQWMNLGENETPSLWQNLSFMNSYQMGFMYWRYFSWNFIGRQNDDQGQGEINHGNWLSGIKPLDNTRLGNQNELPASIRENPGHNLFYGLPLLFGVLGAIYLYRKSKKELLVIAILFFCTGLAIIFYLNQDPLQVRERDYAYVGSFYAFAILIGFGLFPLKELLAKLASPRSSLIAASIVCLFAVPTLMALQGWDDHNRSHKTTALDMAKNYLNSCEPNAILFTNADNDTYPLWYAQEVEGIRTDVRVICLQFLSSEAYIDHLKKQQGKSAPLPISMENRQYKEGVRDYLQYVDYGLTDSVELSDLFSILTSDNKADQVQLNDGSFENFLPTKKIKLTVNPDQVIASNTVSIKDKEQITTRMEWNFDGKYLLKRDLTMFDIISHNNWKRPIYFSSGVSEDTYIGLSKYLYLEGFAYRLLPLKPSSENKEKSEQTNNELAFQHFEKFELNGFKQASCLDPESRRVLQNTWSFANTLAINLIQEGKTGQANKVVSKSLNQLPLTNSSITDTANKISLVQNLHLLSNHNQANRITRSTATYVAQELDYILSLKPEEQRTLIHEIRVGMAVLQNLNQLNQSFGQKDLADKISKYLTNYETKFTASLG